jgi:hypothetical protein
MVMARGRQHVAKFLTKIWKHIGVLKTGEELVREWNHDNKLKEKEDALWPFPTGLHAEVRMRNIGLAEFSWRQKTTGKERLHQRSMKVWWSSPIKDVL